MVDLDCQHEDRLWNDLADKFLGMPVKECLGWVMSGGTYPGCGQCYSTVWGLTLSEKEKVRPGMGAHAFNPRT